ncbi:hypothetical protein ACSBR1_002051 [Camellia fascicularis]
MMMMMRWLLVAVTLFMFGMDGELDAALIVSKCGNVKQGVTLDSYDEKVQEEDGSREMTVNECKKQHLGKQKVRGTSKARGRYSCGRKVKLHHLLDVLWAVSD